MTRAAVPHEAEELSFGHVLFRQVGEEIAGGLELVDIAQVVTAMPAGHGGDIVLVMGIARILRIGVIFNNGGLYSV